VLSSREHHEKPLLHVACSMGLQVVQILLQNQHTPVNIDITTRDEKKHTALQSLVRRSSMQGNPHYDIIELTAA